MKKVIVTGITGQDGSYLAELLLSKGYEVHGIVRPTSQPNYNRLRSIIEDIRLHTADISDLSSIIRIVNEVQPDEFYNLAAQSFVAASFEVPLMTGNVTAIGAHNCLEALRLAKKDCKFYQASSSEMFGSIVTSPKDGFWHLDSAKNKNISYEECYQDESTPFKPRSPYGVSKVYAHGMTVNYRESFSMFACAGILFNHESPRRGKQFVTKKIIEAAKAIKEGRQKELFLGNLSAYRDWGWAPKYCEAMWLMLQQEKPNDYVIATGETHTINEFLSLVFNYFDLSIDQYVKIDPALYRPSEVPYLKGNPAKAKKELGWDYNITWEQFVTNMIEG